MMMVEHLPALLLLIIPSTRPHRWFVIITIQLAGGVGFYCNAQAHLANFRFVAIVAQLQFLCGPVSFNPRSPLGKSQNPQGPATKPAHNPDLGAACSTNAKE
jgi:hypothetical protein